MKLSEADLFSFANPDYVIIEEDDIYSIYYYSYFEDTIKTNKISVPEFIFNMLKDRKDIQKYYVKYKWIGLRSRNRIT